MTSQPISVAVGLPMPARFMLGAFEDRVHINHAHTDEELRNAVRSAEVLYSWRVPETVPAESPQLRWIQLPSAGVDHIRNLPVWNSDIIVTAAQGTHTVPMAEHTFAMLLGLTRRIPDIVGAQERRDWTQHEYQLRLGELRGKTLGIIGWGKIGDGVAHLARAFGMRVIGTRWSVIVPREVPATVEEYSHSPWLEPEDLAPDIVYPPAQTHDVLAQSDIVLLILPLTGETRGSFGEAELRSMKHGAIFLNIGRGQVVDEEALVQSLRSGRLSGAGLDVFAREPLPRSSPLWTMPNVIISPHVGGISDQTRERGAWFFAVNLTRYLQSQELLNIVKRDKGY